MRSPRRSLVRAIVIVLVCALLELAVAHVLATRDPVAAMIGGSFSIVALFVPLYGLRLFLYFAAPPWLVVRGVAVVTGRSRSS